MTLQIEFDYLAKEIVVDKKALNLNTVYDNFENHAKMIIFQGTNDNLIDHRLKEKVVSKIGNATFVLIDEKDVDHHIFKSNTHGLNAVFLSLFDLAYEKMGKYLNVKPLTLTDEIHISNTKISVDYSLGLPVFELL